MSLPAPTPKPPRTYAEFPAQHLRVKNHPENAPGVTPVQVVELYRPTAHNAFTYIMAGEIVSLWDTFAVDDRVKVIVLTGYGKMFCAGADLSGGSAFQRSDNDVMGHRDGGGQCALAIYRCPKPTIAALQGSAVGVGITMTLPATIRIAYGGAKIGFVFARRGLVMEAASSFFLPKLVGMSRAQHIVATGAVYPASHRLLDGLFSEVLDTPGAVLPRALEIADDIAANCSTVSVALMKDMMYRPYASAEEQHLLDSRLIFDLYKTPDIKEGVASFMEKRPVKFTGVLSRDAPVHYPWWTPVDVRTRKRNEGAKL